jgi:hypothetical protein
MCDSNQKTVINKPIHYIVMSVILPNVVAPTLVFRHEADHRGD